MLIRSTILFLLFSTLLTAQSTNWQSYLYANYLVGGVETENHLWLAADNSIAKINPATATEELIYYQNSILPRSIRDIEKLGTDEFVILGGVNELIYWQSGNWNKQVLQVPDNDDLLMIVGQTSDQELLLAGRRKLYQLTSAGEVVHLPYPEQALQNQYIREAELDSEGQLWITDQLSIVKFASDGSVLANWEATDEYIQDMKIDHTDNAWFTTNQNVYLWVNELQTFEQLPLEDLGIGLSGAIISAVLEHKAIFTSYNRVFMISYTDGAFQVEELSNSFLTTQTPGTYGYQDKNDRLWYINQLRELTHWQAGTDNHAQTSVLKPWLQLSEITTVKMDPQGKIWLGGSFKTAYQIGGRWQVVPLDTITFFPIGVNDIVFKSDGTPIVGTGSLFVFGFPDSNVREWNGTTWDILPDAVTGSSFLPVTDIEMDPDENLWVLRAFDNLFSVRNLGSWYRFRTIDMPMTVNAFTCFGQDLDGSMWIGTNNGLIHYDGFTFSVVTTDQLKAVNLVVSSIAIDEKGGKWATFDYGGLRREVNNEWVVVEEIAELAEQYGVSKVVCGKYPEVWVTLGWNGVLHYDGENWEHFTPENSGLHDTHVVDILCDNTGRVWFASNWSVSVYSPDSPPIKPYQRPVTHTIGIYPNPGCCQYEVNWRAAQTGDYTLTLFNASGQIAKHWQVETTQKGEQFFSFEQGDLAAGSYFLSISSADQQIGTQSLVVLQ